MKIYNNIQEFKPNKQTVVTLGTFDGVHAGHKKIIEHLTKSAKESGCESLVLTFFPHPKMILRQNENIKLLNTIEERSLLLEEAGLDALIIHSFDQKFAQLSPEEFVKQILIDQFKLKKIIIGYDHQFGRNRTANIDDLIIFGKRYHFEVEQIPVQEIEEVSISSTEIREALIKGNITLANNYLGYHYLLTGTVVHGSQLGRTINFPTANIEIKEKYKLIPKNGVYAVKSNIKNQVVYGMMNIGNRPTVDGKTQSVEINYLNFNADLYGQELQIALLTWIRDEQKFDSLDALRKQLEKDRITTLNFVKKN